MYNIDDLPKDILFEAVATSGSYRDIAEKLGFNKRSPSIREKIKIAIQKYEINTSHFSRIQRNKKAIRGIKHPLESILIKNSSYTNIQCLKKRIVEAGLKKYSCEKCGNDGEWMGEKISLQLDHINGKNDDHRIENLRFLCPNCHSQTKTFGGKNSHRAVGVKINEEEVVNLLKNGWLISEILEELNCSKTQGNYKTIKSIAKNNNIEFTARKNILLVPKKRESKKYPCKECGKNTESYNKKYCDKCRPEKYRKEVKWPNKEDLEKLIWKIPTVKIAKMLGVSDKAVEKKCKKFNINKPPRGYWAKNGVVDL